jgi:YhcG PDDEXK nuclease domain
MQTGKRAAVRTKEIESKTNVVASVEFVVRAALHDSVQDDFVLSIAGRIIAETESRGEEDAGQISASLVQFGEALDHGISAERLGDGVSGDISEYWEHLFDAETDITTSLRWAQQINSAVATEMLERDLERGLIDHLRDLILELGKGFAFVGNQYHLEIGGQDYFLDLLFYHLRLRCYVVIDLKIEEFRPEFARQNEFLSVGRG